MNITHAGIGAIIFGVLCLIKPLGKHLSVNAPELVWAFVLTLTATFAGVFLAVQLESKRGYEFEANIFKRSFTAIMVEVSDNQSKIDALKGNSTDAFQLFHLDTIISASVITNPLLYKYSGQEYWTALEGYIGLVGIVNKAQDLLSDKIKSHGKISDEDLASLKQRLELAEYYLRILLMQTRLYIIIHDVRSVQPGNFQEVEDLLNTYGDKKVALEKIAVRTKEFENMNDDLKKTLRERFKKAIEE